MSPTFNYVRYDDASIKLQEEFKRKFEDLEKLATEFLPASRPRSLFMTAIEEAYMWTGKAIRDEQIKRNSQTAHVPERSAE